MDNQSQKKRKKYRKKPKQHIGKKQLKELLENTSLPIDAIAKKMKTKPEIVRNYIQKYGL